jgi:hypothetical protein
MLSLIIPLIKREIFLDQSHDVFRGNISNEIMGIYLCKKLNSGKKSHIAETICAMKFDINNSDIEKRCECSLKTVQDLDLR